ncbi:hypothetical protein [Streptomyces microflavus]|uniref:hypothetical protein n=1 Tax=Streptomyces microflavus TaxID=1919 RepID=UPI003B227A99
MNAHDESAVQALSTAGAFCGVCGFQPGDRGCPDCEACWAGYVKALRAAGWAPRAEALDEAADEIQKSADDMERVLGRRLETSALERGVADRLRRMADPTKAARMQDANDTLAVRKALEPVERLALAFENTG